MHEPLSDAEVHFLRTNAPYLPGSRIALRLGVTPLELRRTAHELGIVLKDQSNPLPSLPPCMKEFALQGLPAGALRTTYSRGEVWHLPPDAPGYTAVRRHTMFGAEEDDGTDQLLV